MLRISWSTQTDTVSSDGIVETESAEHTLQFDAVLSETHEIAATLTEHAVESGAAISDHKLISPDRINIEALVTNTPLDAPPASGYGTTKVSTSIQATGEETERASVVVYSAEFDRISDVEHTLRRLLVEATPLTVSTRIHTYEDAQIVSVSIPREPDDGDSIRVQISFQQIRVAETRDVATPAPREPRGRRTTDAGGQEGTAETRERSTLSTARDEYNRRREAGESVSDSLLGAIGG